MQKFIAILALAAAFIPSSLLAQTARHRFADHGVTYTYTVESDAKGRQIIEGHSQPGGAGFRLVVDGDRVSGVSGGQEVAFRTPEAKGALVAAR